MEKINYLFSKEQYKIAQNTSGFNFSLDSLLLANFVTIKSKAKHILDIGTGNAPIPVLLTTRTKAKIYGIEIQTKSYNLAKKTIYINNLEKQIEIINDDVKKWSKDKQSDCYDTIVCNPPFFEVKKDSNLNKGLEKSLARHEMNLTLAEICGIAKKLLINGGNIALVYRPERLVELIMTMKNNNIEPKRLLFVYPKKDKNANTILIEGTKNGKKGLKILPPLFVHNKSGQYTEQLLKFLD